MDGYLPELLTVSWTVDIAGPRQTTRPGTNFDDTFNLAANFTGIFGNFVEVRALDGNDTINGNGNTRASFAGANGAVEVDLAAGTSGARVGGPDAGATNVGSDLLFNVNQARGSNFADLLLGTNGNQFESFRGQAGDDYIDGRGGTNDRADYRNSTSGIFADLATGIIQDGFGTTDTVVNIEQVRGSEFEDTISGDARDNRLEGRDGNDTISGGLGFNTFLGGRGDDTLINEASSNSNDGGRAEYIEATAGITVEMGHSGGAFGRIGDASVGTDSLERVEQVRGTNFDDTYTANTSWLSTNNDTFNEFEGGGGNYTIISNGNTRVSYLNALASVTVDLAAGTGTSTAPADAAGVGSDTFTNVNQVRGSGFADFLYGTTGNDSFRGQAGADTIDGRGGSDRADYRNSNGAITADLNAGTIQDGFGSTDTVISIERVRGSGFDDTIRGNGGDNILEGLDGNDSLRGRGGADTLIGGLGNDTADYSQESAFVTVNLAAGTASGTSAGTDSLSGIEEVRGSAFADTLTGDDLVGFDGNTFRGLAGNDVINGGKGFDEVRYDSDAGAGGTAAVTVNLATGTATDGFGNTDTLSNIETVGGTAQADTLIGNSRTNLFRGLAGADAINGGDGFDEVRYDRDANFGGNLAVTVNLATQTATDGFGNTDTLISIEGVRGTGLADTFIGNGEDNSFTGIGGADAFDGGAGSDEVRYDIDAARGGLLGVTVDLTAGTATDGFGATDTLVSIERVRGTRSNDNLVGNAADNVFRGLAGNDTISGEGGNDWVSYARDINVRAEGETLIGVNVNLQSVATDSFGDTDTLYSIENAEGGTLDDIFDGTAGDNVFRGFSGNDVITGWDGSDTVDYHVDADFGLNVAFEDGSAGVSVNLGLNTATDGFGDTDTLFFIENVIGTDAADTIIGSAEANRLDGRGGNDLLTGELGADVFEFRAGWGTDTITDFEDGSDTFDLTAFLTIDDVADLTIAQDGLDVTIAITGDPANVIRVQGTTVAQFTNADFDFFS